MVGVAGAIGVAGGVCVGSELGVEALKFIIFSYASCNFGSSGAPVGPLAGDGVGDGADDFGSI